MNMIPPLRQDLEVASPDRRIANFFHRWLQELARAATADATIVWSTDKTWDEVYSEIQAAGGAAVVFVETSGTTARTTTAGEFDLSRCVFYGYGRNTTTYQVAIVELVEGFTLAEPTLVSYGVTWYLKMAGRVYDNVDRTLYLSLTAGGIFGRNASSTAAPFRVREVNASLFDGGTLSASLLPASYALFQQTGASVIASYAGAVSGQIAMGSGTLAFNRDSASDAAAAGSVIGTVSLSNGLLSKATNVSYTDSAPLLSASTTQAAIDALKSNCPPGTLIEYAKPNATAPTGWLRCDGSAVSRTTYANLFAVTGTSYGAGDGTTTFNLPSYDATETTTLVKT